MDACQSDARQNAYPRISFWQVCLYHGYETIPDEELPYLKGLEVLVVNALRFDKPHHSHQLVDDAIRFAIRIGAEKVYFTHMTHDIGLHDAANKRLPKGFQFGYDGQVIEL